MSSTISAATPGAAIPGLASPGLASSTSEPTLASAVFEVGINKLRWTAGALAKHWDAPDE